jgi:hypothetical protein
LIEGSVDARVRLSQVSDADDGGFELFRHKRLTTVLSFRL